MKKRSPEILLWALLILWAILPGCADSNNSNSSDQERVASVANQPIATYQLNLLDLAFKAVSAMPVNPHIKDRSLAQYNIATACFELEQPGKALDYIEAIDNWRRGAGYADYAYYAARQGDHETVANFLDQARIISELPEEEIGQAWRKDHIRAKIAKTHLLLGQVREAAIFESGLKAADSLELEAMKTASLEISDADFKEQIKSAAEVLTKGDMDQSRKVLERCAQLYKRFYANTERRALAESQIRTSLTQIPMTLAIDLMMRLAGYALEHGDQDKALELISETASLVEEIEWLPEDLVPVKARLAKMRFAAGDQEKARLEADAALALYNGKRTQILNFNRADALRPLAETYQALGDTPAALAAFKKALVEGAVNPNSRSRAEDLSATCCSMALYGVDPGSDLWKRMQRICDELGHPW